MRPSLKLLHTRRSATVAPNSETAGLPDGRQVRNGRYCQMTEQQCAFRTAHRGGLSGTARAARCEGGSCATGGSIEKEWLGAVRIRGGRLSEIGWRERVAFVELSLYAKGY